MDDPVPGKGKELTDVEDMKWCLPLEEEEEAADVGWWESSSSMPTPMDGLREPVTPPFLTKTYEMVDDPATDPVVSWGRGQCTFVVRDPLRFSADLLPKHFKHNNFSSFLRQLNTYGFRKVDSERWEFANKGFLRGHKHLLKTIKRRRSGTSQLHHHHHDHHHTGGGNGDPSQEVCQLGLEQQIEALTMDRDVLLTEVLRLRQKQQMFQAQMCAMDERIRSTESKHQYMMEFVSRALRIPNFLESLVQWNQKETLMIEEDDNNKRKRSLSDGVIIQSKENAAAFAATHFYELIASSESSSSTSPITCQGWVSDQSSNSLGLVGPDMIGHVDDHGGHHNADDNWEELDDVVPLPHEEEEDRCDELAGIHTGVDELMKIILDYWGEEDDKKGKGQDKDG